MIINLKVVKEKFLDPADLFKAHIFCVHKSSEFVVVDKYKNFMLKIF